MPPGTPTPATNVAARPSRCRGIGKFADPIELPGKRLITLRDAAEFTKLPKGQHDAEEWQAAMEALFVAELAGPAMFARIAIMRAMNRHVERMFIRRKLARDE